MKISKISIILLVLFFSISCSNKKEQSTEYVKARQEVEHYFVSNNPYEVLVIDNVEAKSVKNVIFMIGDGMGANVVQSASVANRGELYMETMPIVGVQMTASQDSIITDSAAGATAMATGSKTKRGRVNYDADGNPLKRITEYAKEAGLSTGVISTARIVDATPACYLTKNIDRNDYENIAKSYIGSGVDYVFGGGENFFNKRKDGKNLIPELEAKGYQVVFNVEDLANIKQGKVFAFGAKHDMADANERGDALWKGTEKALELLSQNKKGFFLMVEAAKIDDHGHGNNLPKMMEETLDFDRTVGEVLRWASKHKGTLVIVTADHGTGGLTLTGGNAKKGEVIGYYSTGDHDGSAVPVYAFGARAEEFKGTYQNTELFVKIKKLLNL